MPKIIQPMRLEMIALHGSCTWLFSIGEEMMPILKQYNQQNERKATQTLKMRVDMLRDLFEWNVPHMLFDTLSTMLFRKIPTFIEQLKPSLEHSATSLSKFLSSVNVAVTLTEILISTKLRQLDFEVVPKMMRHLFCSKLELLGGLRYLNLGSMSGGWKTDDMEPLILNGIQHLIYLQVFILNYDCTDNILHQLCKTSPRLHTLDVSSSKSINNDSISIVCHMTALRNIQLYRTSVTGEGYTKLLITMKLLEDVGRYDELGRCLEYIDFRYHDQTNFNLKRFGSRFVTLKHLQLLAEKCPNIEIVSIFHNPLISDLMALIGLNNLKDLQLMSCDFFGDQVRDVLEVKGCNLTHLHLEHVDEIDMNALMYISQFCPDLKVLTLYSCELIESTSLYTNKRLPVPPFMNLERLTLASQCVACHIEFLLFNAINLKYIHLGTSVPTHDYLFQRILANNPLEYLEELKVVQSDGLTIGTAYKLVENCPRLSFLRELESWNEVKPNEYETFKKFVKLKNYDIDL